MKHGEKRVTLQDLHKTTFFQTFPGEKIFRWNVQHQELRELLETINGKSLVLYSDQRDVLFRRRRLKIFVIYGDYGVVSTPALSTEVLFLVPPELLI